MTGKNENIKKRKEKFKDNITIKNKTQKSLSYKKNRNIRVKKYAYSMNYFYQKLIDFISNEIIKLSKLLKISKRRAIKSQKRVMKFSQNSSENIIIGKIEDKFSEIWDAIIRNYELKLKSSKYKKIQLNNNNLNSRTLKLESVNENDFNISKILKSRINKTTLNCIGSIKQVESSFIPSPIISAIESNPTGEIFVMGGATKSINFYQYNNISPDLLITQPIAKIPCESKITSFTWPIKSKSILYSAYSHGTISVWDVENSKIIYNFREHTKKVWDIKAANYSNNIIISGSEDSQIKLWSSNLKTSLFTINHTSPVSTIAWNPINNMFFAYGSIDNNIYYKDIRYLKDNISVLKSHGNSITYLDFFNSCQIASSSTDSTIKSWEDLSSSINNIPFITFKGHKNFKYNIKFSICNFNNLDYIACGSEDNKIHLYSKNFPSEITSISLDYGNNFALSASPTTSFFETSKNHSLFNFNNYNLDHDPFSGLPNQKKPLNLPNGIITTTHWNKINQILIVANSCGLTRIFKIFNKFF